MTSPAPARATPLPTIETRYSWTVASAALVVLAFSFGGPWIAAVGLKDIAADLGGARSVPALAGSLAWFGSAAGGIAMGPLAMRFGVRWTAILGAAMIAVGLAVSTLGGAWPLYLGHGLFMGVIGDAGINAPLYGLGFSAIVPAYVLAVREFFPAREAGWRVPAILFSSGSGMAAGGWLAGLLYDRFGFYGPAFATGIGFNLLNLLVIGILALRRREHGGARFLQASTP